MEVFPMKHQKDFKTILVEFVSSLSEEDLKLLVSRLVDRYCGDLGDALDFISKRPQIDSIFVEAKTADEVYQLCEVIRDIALRESKKRKINLREVKSA